MTISPVGQCVIHSHSYTEGAERFVKIQNFESWLTLLDAAKIRSYRHLTELENGNIIPDISYHRYCRTRFTIKK